MRGEQTPLPSLVFCPLLLGGETWSSAPAYIQEGRKGVTRLPYLLPDVSLAPSQVGWPSPASGTLEASGPLTTCWDGKGKGPRIAP